MSGNFLEVEIRHRLGALTLDARFACTAPWTVLFGASGGGKTTVLRTIAGFVRPGFGRIVRGKKTIIETLIDSERSLFLPAHRRAVRSAGQAARLFANLTVRANLAYGASPPATEEAATLFRLQGLMDKLPPALSGGERQRVSVARAVASAVSADAWLLLDEPFAGMDSALRDAIAVELRDWLAARKIPVLSVTHDVGEAFLLNAEVVRIAGGRVVAQGPAARVLAEERTRLLARLGHGDDGPTRLSQ